MSKRPKKRPAKRATETVADRERLDAKRALQKSLRLEREIQGLSRQLGRALKTSDDCLAELARTVLDRVTEPEPDDKLQEAGVI